MKEEYAEFVQSRLIELNETPNKNDGITCMKVLRSIFQSDRITAAQP